ncbi:MAG: peptidoglycan-binding protein, partial [Bacteroidota bacterium]
GEHDVIRYDIDPASAGYGTFTSITPSPFAVNEPLPFGAFNDSGQWFVGGLQAATIQISDVVNGVPQAATTHNLVDPNGDPVDASEVADLADMVYFDADPTDGVPGYFYGVQHDMKLGILSSVPNSDGTLTYDNTTALTGGGATNLGYGAAWLVDGDTLLFSHNAGTIYELDINNNQLTAISSGQRTSNNDGFGCGKALLPGTPELTVLKGAVDNFTTPFAAVGDIIDYTITVENTGNVDLASVVVTDALLGGDITASCVFPTTAGELVVGEVATCELPYEITQADIDAAGVENTASATGEDADGNPVEDDSDSTSGVPEGNDGTGEDDPTYTEIPVEEEEESETRRSTRSGSSSSSSSSSSTTTTETVTTLSGAFKHSYPHCVCGYEVYLLQVLLNHNGYPVTTSGAGSAGNETDCFGFKTYTALKQFQANNGIQATGLVYADTVMKLNELLANGTLSFPVGTDLRSDEILTFVDYNGGYNDPLESESFWEAQGIHNQPTQTMVMGMDTTEVVTTVPTETTEVSESIIMELQETIIGLLTQIIAIVSGQQS